jgi:hypothetical protein
MTSGPYKSKVLNFVSGQYRQFLDRSDRLRRHLKFAASNTLQLLLYPVYVLLQASRLAVKQLQQTVDKYTPQIQGNVKSNSQKYQRADESIQEVLEAATKILQAEQPQRSEPSLERLPIPKFPTAPRYQVFQPLLFEIKSCTTAILPSTSTQTITATAISEILIRGIASVLENKQLVLVTVDNQVLDILTKEQQKQLNQRIILEIAKIDHQLPLQLKPCGEIAPKFRPLGGFWQIMAWVQTSGIALRLNLFGESNLLSPTQELSQQAYMTFWPTPPLLPGSNLTFGGFSFVHNLLKYYLYPVTTGLGFRGLLPPFEMEKLPLDSVLESELAQESLQMRSLFQFTASSIGSKTSQAEIFQNHSDLSEAPLVPLATILTTSNSAEMAPPPQMANRLPKHQPDWLEVKSVSVGYLKHPLEEILGWVDVIMTRLETVVAEVWQWAKEKWQNF